MTKKQKKVEVQQAAAELATAAVMFVSKPAQNRREADMYRMAAQDAMDNLRLAIEAAFPREPIQVLPPVQTGNPAGEQGEGPH